MNNYSKAAREARAAYMRQWRHDNPEKNKEAQRLYWERRAAREAAMFEEQEEGRNDQQSK